MNRTKRMVGSVLAVAAVAAASGVQAGNEAITPTATNEVSALQVSSMFGDHAVLQRELPVPVWGRSRPGTTVTIEFSGQKKTATAGQDGKWMAQLDPLSASATPQEMVIGDDAGNKVTLKDILVGEVWICSGQSNMQYGTGQSPQPVFSWGHVPALAELVPDARTKPLRSYTVPMDVSLTPNDRCAGTWSQEPSGSAVAFGFSYHLHQKLQVPVGVIVSCWGSAFIEGFMPRDMTAQLPHFKKMMDDFDSNPTTLDRIRRSAGRCRPHGNVFERQQPHVLYNAMLHPVIPYASRGMVWYQGEANAGRPGEYAESLPLWIHRLRAGWGNDKFHVLVVMLPGFSDGNWPRFREVQLGILKTPHTSVVNTIDLGDARDIHPADKAPIGERLALLARRDVYGERIEAQGPVYRSSSAAGSRMVIEFDHADGLKTKDGAAPTGFELAGADKVWRPATASIKGATVALEADGLASPSFVRYAFAPKPAVNLVNGADLPAYPFREDDATLDP